MDNKYTFPIIITKDTYSPALFNFLFSWPEPLGHVGLWVTTWHSNHKTPLSSWQSSFIQCRPASLVEGFQHVHGYKPDNEQEQTLKIVVNWNCINRVDKQKYTHNMQNTVFCLACEWIQLNQQYEMLTWHRTGFHYHKVLKQWETGWFYTRWCHYLSRVRSLLSLD